MINQDCYVPRPLGGESSPFKPCAEARGMGNQALFGLVNGTVGASYDSLPAAQPQVNPPCFRTFDPNTMSWKELDLIVTTDPVRQHSSVQVPAPTLAQANEAQNRAPVHATQQFVTASVPMGPAGPATPPATTKKWKGKERVTIDQVYDKVEANSVAQFHATPPPSRHLEYISIDPNFHRGQRSCRPTPRSQVASSSTLSKSSTTPHKSPLTPTVPKPKPKPTSTPTMGMGVNLMPSAHFPRATPPKVGNAVSNYQNLAYRVKCRRGRDPNQGKKNSKPAVPPALVRTGSTDSEESIATLPDGEMGGNEYIPKDGVPHKRAGSYDNGEGPSKRPRW